jgi:hypothetical protein
MNPTELTISRVNKIYDKHKNLTGVEYFYTLSFKQKIFLEKILVLWASLIPSELPVEYEKYTKIIRQVLRTNEYSEDFQIQLQIIRTWYIRYKQSIKK